MPTTALPTPAPLPPPDPIRQAIAKVGVAARNGDHDQEMEARRELTVCMLERDIRKALSRWSTFTPEQYDRIRSCIPAAG